MHAALEAAAATMVPPAEPVLNDDKLDALDAEGDGDGKRTSESSD